MDNRLVITGHVLGAPELRHTPAGVPISRFVLRHASQRTHEGAPREVRCEIQVVASGALAVPAQALQDGTAVRVTGFVARASYRTSARYLVLHAEHFETVGQAPADSD